MFIIEQAMLLPVLLADAPNLLLSRRWKLLMSAVMAVWMLY